MLDKYTGFYFHPEGVYENIVYYVGPKPDYKFYMIRKKNQMLNTNDVLKAIETEFDGIDFEVNEAVLKAKPFYNTLDVTETNIVMEVDLYQFADRQMVEDAFIVADSSMPLFEQLYEFLQYKTSELESIQEFSEEQRKQDKDNYQKNLESKLQQLEPVESPKKVVTADIPMPAQKNENNQ